MARVVERGWTRKVHAAAGINLLFYEATGEWRFEHVCDRSARGAGVIICAPLLSDMHVIVTLDPLTITPSIMCSDCGTHGLVRDDAWVPA